MPKRIELPPAVARAFVRDMRAYFAEKDGARRDAIVAHQAWSLNQRLAKQVKTHAGALSGLGLAPEMLETMHEAQLMC